MKRFLNVALILALFVGFGLAANPASLVRAKEALHSIKTEQFLLPIHYCQSGESHCKWWAIVDDNSIQSFGAPCDPEGVDCVTRITEGNKKFARLSVGNDPTPGGYNNVEYSELQTGVSYHQGLEPWSPTVNHPVIFTETLRFGPNYNQDGSGGAIGTAGGGLWNSYPSGFPDNPTLQPITAFWWSWGEQGTAFGQLDSLSVNVFNENNLVYFQKVPVTLDMHNWMTWIETWSALPNGKQQVKFSVIQNGHVYVVGDTHDFYPDGIDPLSPLSITNWNDNQFVTDFDQYGNPIIDFHNPAPGVVDYWDLNGMTISQP